MTPDEPPVGAVVTAYGSSHFWERDDEGWWAVNRRSGRRMDVVAVGALRRPPAATWAQLARDLTAWGGILTVTTEYQVEYRWDDSSERHRGRQILGGFRSREHVRSWADQMNRTSAAVLILAIRSQQVTRSAWTDEPLEDPT